MHISGTLHEHKCKHQQRPVHLSDTKTTFDSGGAPQAAGRHKQIPGDTRNGKDSEPRTGFVRELLSAVLLSEADPDSLLWRERSEDLKKQSKLMLKMIYFFQVLPFYLLQFCSGMGVGELLIKYRGHSFKDFELSPLSGLRFSCQKFG
jgi:hypothetical protein